MVQGKRIWIERSHTPSCPPDPLKEEVKEMQEQIRAAA
jgi:hypothetical protein